MKLEEWNLKNGKALLAMTLCGSLLMSVPWAPICLSLGKTDRAKMADTNNSDEYRYMP